MTPAEGTTRGPDMAAEAVALAARGFRVLLVHSVRDGVCSCRNGAECGKSAGKHPRFGEWQKEASTKAADVQRWWRRFPDSNIGLAMGGLARFIAVDVDGPDGLETLVRLEREHGPLPATLTSLSGRAEGGQHRIFRVPEDFDMSTLGNRVGSKKSGFPGLDLRAEGGQIVAPPSMHYTGRRYAWVDSQAPIVDAPLWLLELFTHPPERGPASPEDGAGALRAPRPSSGGTERDVRAKRAAAYLAKMPGAVAGEQGHAATFLAAQRMTRGFDLDEDTAFRLLRDDYNQRCRPPWDLADLKRKVAQAASEGTIVIGSLLVDRDPPTATSSPRTAPPNTQANSSAPKASPPAIDLVEVLTNDPGRAFAPDVLAAAASLDELGAAYQAALVVLRSKRVSVKDWRAAVRARRPSAPKFPEADDDELADVRAALLLDEKDRPRKHVANVVTLLARDPRWEGRLAYHAMRESPIITQAIEWHADDAPAKPYTGPWTDADSVRAASWLARMWGFDVSPKVVSEAIETVSRRVVVDPLRDYLTGLRWDGIVRLPGFVASYFSGEDTEYTREIGKRWLISAVARAMRPGEKVDCVLVLEGNQGTFKSSALRALCPFEDLFSDDELALGNKDAAQSLAGKWIWELGELDKMSRHELGVLKAFITRQIDTYRPSYGIRARDFRRSTVFAASVNEREYLGDEENRRFWPVRAPHCWPKELARDRDQLWAEAFTRWESGEAWYVDTPELAALCRAEQDDRKRVDPWEEAFAKFLAEKLGTQCQARFIGERCNCPWCVGVTTSAALTGAVKLEVARQTLSEEKRAARLLRCLGWAQGKQRRLEGSRVRPFYPPAPAEGHAPQEAMN